MVTIDGISSLNIVKDEVESTLKLAEGSLEAFVENKDNLENLKTSTDYIKQVKGIFRLIGLPGATLLTNELEFLCNEIISREGDGDAHAELSAIGNGLIVLSHYLEYVHVKQSSLPVLLIPAINEIRQISRRELEPESRFFSVDLNVVRSFDKEVNPVNADELPKLCRRLRHMYQVGLIGVIRGDNIATNLKLMHRALERIDRMCGDVPMGRLWWVAIALTEAMASGNLELTNRRKSVLGGIDRQIKQLVFLGANVIEKEPDAQLMKECLYLVSLSPADSGTVSDVQSAFSVDTVGITDEMLQAERELMNGPGGSVIQTVAKALQEEIAQIKDVLDLGARGAQTRGEEGFNTVTEALGKIAHTMVMLGLVEPSNVLKDLAERMSQWEKREIDPDGEEFHSIADALLYVENSISELRKSKTSSAVDDMPVENESISIGQLEEARHVVVGESRAGLSLAKRAISSYIDSHWDDMHLNNVPTTLKTVWGGLKFLQLERAASVLDRCNQFIETKLITVNEDSPNEQIMETLADALTSIDYYLESMEGNKPIGDGVLDVAEESVDELGFPVAMA